MEPDQVHDLLARIPFIDELRAARRAEDESAWLVGGCVRDLLIARTPADVDVAAEHPEPLARRFAGLTDGRVVPMDPERGIWRVALHGGLYFDFCRFRDTDILGDLRGRDFSINAIAIHLPENGDTGGLFDPFHGLDDLNNGILRAVDRTAFRDDPARILRAFRFLADFDFTIDTDTLTALRSEVDRLPLVAPERLMDEWWKLCAGSAAAKSIQQMDQAGVLTTLFPELRACKGVTQNAYHHLDVWHHLLLATTNMVQNVWRPDETFQELLPVFQPVFDSPHRRARLVFLALIHDIGKPQTRSVKAGRVHFYRHELAGEEIAAQLCRRMRVSRDDVRTITTIIRQHLRPLQLMHAEKDGSLAPRVLIKFLDDVGEYLLDILLLAFADKSASRGPASEPDIQGQLLALFRTVLAFHRNHYLPAIEQPLLNGTDLTQQLHLPPGPQIGRLLGRLRDRQILGDVRTHHEALAWAKKHRHE